MREGIGAPSREAVRPEVLERVVSLAVEIAREGREVETLFVVGDAEALLDRSRPVILDPLAGHPDEKKRVEDPGARATVRQLARLNGAFLASDGGVVVSAARRLDAVPEDAADLAPGPGRLSAAAASVSGQTGTVTVALSERSTVQVFEDGRLVRELSPRTYPRTVGAGSPALPGRAVGHAAPGAAAAAAEAVDAAEAHEPVPRPGEEGAPRGEVCPPPATVGDGLRAAVGAGTQTREGALDPGALPDRVSPYRVTR